MCELCSDDPATRMMAIEGQQMFAARLSRLARFYNDVAAGRIKPHTPEWKTMHHDMKQVTKEFLEILL